MKNIFLLSILLLLSGGTYYFVFNEKFEAIDQYDANFAIKNATKLIDKIEIVEANGKKILLEKAEDNDVWFCNQYYLAREDAVRKLLKLAEKLKIDKPITQKGKDNIKSRLLKNGRQVKYYEKGKTKPTKHYYINGGPPDRKGAYMLLEGAEKPYVVRTPTLLGSPEIMFHTNLEKWRTHRIFGGDASDIKILSVAYPNNVHKNFTIKNNEGNLSVVNGGNCPKDKTPNVLTLKVLFDKVVKFNIEAYDNTFTKRDAILSGDVYCTINIEARSANLSQVINIYRMPINDKSKLIKMPEGEQQLYDVDRYFASINKGNDFVIVQQFAFEDLFNKSCASFY